MYRLPDFRAGKPGFYPDQAIYAEYACAHFGLGFAEHDAGTGLLFSVTAPPRTLSFGAGRGSFYPQNNATAATLANDKYLANAVLARAGIASLGGRYFFLHARHRALRPPGHERADALAYLAALGGRAFVKPLLGSRGDFAQMIESEAALSDYLDAVSRYYDSVLIQPLARGHEYRIFVIDDEILYCARKYPPALLGDGVRSIDELLTQHDLALRARGLSPAAIAPNGHDVVLASGARWEIPGRMNLSIGGTMALEAPEPEQEACAIARASVRALGLRLGAVDIFVEPGPDQIRVIEVNSNPSIRFLEDCGRDDLILAIWRHTFTAMGLL
ncbi:MULTISPECIES: hypothetical protein [Rhodopseudomonas]|uniref:ATP-grasp domain-containing protein n=1 Tax=Rhodopseudomonas palustris TaxID=1076 RepID=A0A0D7E2C3_RHOPL|nr:MULTISPECIES: hypothetical protein [Rhodopseudomonas]KIZ33742.1 hypothetical protein OO17_28165 [Rhodopseudomonas palustris]MDF3811890.1 hypothetical protein [Rhodopseudomonas sp. BAL398]WOK16655.1 hypothetical protein RBJ75_21280 [Rhodopseudomonas sp. BAL398]